jgi:hypothetical protein
MKDEALRHNNAHLQLKPWREAHAGYIEAL